MVNHYDKHKKFIPSCNICKKARDSAKEEKKDAFIRKEMPTMGMPEDDNGKPIFHRQYEKVIIFPTLAAEVDSYFNNMYIWGYDFVTQLDFRPKVGDIILIFKKREK